MKALKISVLVPLILGIVLGCSKDDVVFEPGNHGGGDYWIVKLDGSGDIQWQKSLGGSEDDRVRSIHQTTDGGFVVAGWTSSNDGDVSGNPGHGDHWIVKLNESGAIQWQKCLGGSGEYGIPSIQQTTDGGFIVAGYTFPSDLSGSDFWIVKLDATGNIQWQKSLGGSMYDWPSSVHQTTDGGFIVAGGTESNDGDVSGNHGGADYWIVKLDGSGNIQWQKCLGGSGNEQAWSIQQTTDGFIVAGSTDSNDGDVSGNHGRHDYWAVKLDASGDIQGQNCLGGSENEWVRSIQQTTDGGCIAAGGTDSNDGDVSGNHGAFDYWVVKLDGTGNIQWQKCLGGSKQEEAWSIQQTTDEGYIVAGNTFSNNRDVSGNHGAFDYWVVKLDGSGDIQWQKCLGGSGGEYVSSIQQTTDGGYIVAGTSESNDGDILSNP